MHPCFPAFILHIGVISALAGYIKTPCLTECPVFLKYTLATGYSNQPFHAETAFFAVDQSLILQ